MKQIIDGKRYDTEKATKVDSNSGNDRGSFCYFQETLYRTARGRWFLAGWGGAMSKYAKPLGNNGSGPGDGIIPLDQGEAREWLECLGGDAANEALEKYFALEDA